MTEHPSPTSFTRPASIDDNCCDQCCATPVVEVIDGDKLCRTCADKWRQEPDEDEIAELRRSLRHAGVNRGALIEARFEELERWS